MIYFNLFPIQILVDPATELSSTQVDILCQNCKKVDSLASRVAGEHKELHGALSKIGKSIDRVSKNLRKKCS